MTYLVSSVWGDSLKQVRQRIDEAVSSAVDIIELRLDLMEGLEDDHLRSLRQHVGVPLLLTIRSAAEGGAWEGGDDERISRLIELGPMAHYIDVEWTTWQRSADLRGKIALALERAGHVLQADGKEEIDQAAHRRLILSKHDLLGRPIKLHADLLALVSEPACSVAKIAWRARTIRDNFEALELMRISPKPVIVICMGEDGLLSRVLAKKFGAFGTFAACSPGSQTAPGQPLVADLKHLYRWDGISADTRVYGLIGDPVRHSLGPAVHNAAFAALDLDAVYLPMRVDPSFESFKAFMVEVLARPWLDFRGFSVTSPHKQNAARFIREFGGRLDDLADRLDAVNTLTLSPEGALTGHNADYTAALEAICAGLGCQPAGLAGMNVAVLGAGGVARAVVAALAEAGARLTIFNRDTAKARLLADAFDCRVALWGDRLACDASLLVNCTSVGMWPAVDDSVMPEAVLKPPLAVFDVVYTPPQTKLLRDAAAKGCGIISGLTMFAMQAREQSRRWTDRVLPLDLFLRTAQSALDSARPPT
jgi:3-dehydroquinate dehydratase/shikimate dehydrogenase